MADECAFINSAALTPPPHLALAPGGLAYIKPLAALAGEQVFQANCASCHSNGDSLLSPLNVYSDDKVHLASGFNPTLGEPPGDVGTNECRANTTNWDTGRIWAEFSSDELKARGPGYTRDVPLYGIWRRRRSSTTTASDRTRATRASPDASPRSRARSTSS